MPLLLIPLAIAAFLALWLVTLPLAVWQRYRRGRARRRVQPWAIGLNAWSLLLSVVLFLLGAAFIGWWIERALLHAGLGLLAGVLVGLIGVALTRFERVDATQFYTPNRWLVLALTVVVALRIAMGLWHLVPLWQGQGTHVAWLAQQGGLLAVGGLLLGYYLGYAWGLRRRIAQAPGTHGY